MDRTNSTTASRSHPGGPNGLLSLVGIAVIVLCLQGGTSPAFGRGPDLAGPAPDQTVGESTLPSSSFLPVNPIRELETSRDGGGSRGLVLPVLSELSAGYGGGDPALDRTGRRPGQTRTEAWMQSATSPPPVRSPRVAFLMSAVLPGAGQLYNGNHRGYAYLALEAASWFARVSYLDAADRKEDDYRAFADRHWGFDRFLGSEDDEGCGFPPGADTLLANYRETDPDQYYEELGNSKDYYCGWDDAVLDPATSEIVSERRLDYRDQRETSNTYRNRAGLALGVIVLNRVVSAVDAFRVARARQVGESPGLRLTGDLGVDGNHPHAVFRLTKEFP